MDKQAASEEADPAGQTQQCSDAVFRANLQAFGGRASRLVDLLRQRRISPDRCFVAITQLWIQLARSYREVGMDDRDSDSGPAGRGER